MSRSYKKSPVIKEDRSHKEGKKEANSSIRSQLKQGTEIADGSSYKKHFNSYDICDYSFRYSKAQAISDYNANKDNVQKDYPTLKDYLKWWSKWYRHK